MGWRVSVGALKLFRGCKTYEWPLWIDGVKGGWIREEG